MRANVIFIVYFTVLPDIPITTCWGFYCYFYLGEAISFVSQCSTNIIIPILTPKNH